MSDSHEETIREFEQARRGFLAVQNRIRDAKRTLQRLHPEAITPALFEELKKGMIELHESHIEALERTIALMDKYEAVYLEYGLDNGRDDPRRSDSLPPGAS